MNPGGFYHLENYLDSPGIGHCPAILMMQHHNQFHLELRLSQVHLELRHLLELQLRHLRQVHLELGHLRQVHLELGHLRQVHLELGHLSQVHLELRLIHWHTTMK